MKSILIIIISFVCVNTSAQNQVTAQENDRAHKKYWFYRTRMINDFMKLGKNQGESIVFAERNLYQSDITNPELKSTSGHDQIDITNMYMMALALEYKLLTRNNQDVSETIKELYHLLYTFNRLDLEAEQFAEAMPPDPNNQYITPNGLLNGFALREDMPKNFITDNGNLTHFNYQLLENNYPNTPNDYKTYTGFTGVQHTNEKENALFIEAYKDNKINDMFLPHDKYQSLLVALMFIDKYIPAGTEYTENGVVQTFQDGETKIKQEARNIAQRCYNYLKGPNGYWVLKMVDMNGNYGNNILFGEGAWLYSWPFSRMACKASRDFPWGLGSANYACSGYNSSLATTVGKISYDILSSAPIKKDDLGVFLAWSQAGSNSTPVFNTIPSSVAMSLINAIPFNPSAPPTPPVFSGVPVPVSQLMQLNTALNSVEWAELLRKVLHQDEILLRQLSVYSTPLFSAPCQGPYNFSSCVDGGWEWSSPDRLEHPSRRGNGCSQNGDAFWGNYPGVDYMLLHNLYYEYQNQLIDGQNGNVGGNWLTNGLITAQTAVFNTINSGGNGGTGSSTKPSSYYGFNYMDNFDMGIWPYKIPTVGGGLGGNVGGGNIIIGTTLNPLKYSVFQNLKSIAHIYYTQSPSAQGNNTPSDVRYRAGKEINLLPGFEVDAGSTFHAYISRYVCSGNGDDMSSFRLAKDSTNPYENDYEMDDINMIPTHYIESPPSDADLNPVVSTTPEDYILPTQIDNEYLLAQDFAILPNPNNGIFNIHAKKEYAEEKLNINVYDMKGQLIANYKDISDELKVDLKGYSKGIYMIQLISSSGKSLTKRVDVVE